MKRKVLKYIAFFFVLCSVCFSFTGCGDLESPSRATISNVLDQNGCFLWKRASLDTNEEKIASTFSIDESNRDTSNSYICKVTVNNPYSYVTEKIQYELHFVLDENNKWKCDSLTQLPPPSNGSNKKISRKISNADVRRALTGVSYDLPSGMHIEFKDIYKIVIQEHKVDEYGFSDRVTIKYSANYDFEKYEFTADVFFNYKFNDVTKEGEWFYYEADFDDYIRTDLSDLYKYDPTKGELYWIFKDCELDFCLETSYYRISKGTVSEYKYEEVDQDGSEFLKVPSSFKYENDNISVDISADMYMYFNNQGWRVDRLENVKITRAKTPLIGTWTGVDADGAEYTIDILENTNDNSQNIVNVTIKRGDETISYESYVYSYKLKEKDSTVRIDFNKWITLPSNGDEYAYRDFVGTITDEGKMEIKHAKKWVANKQIK